MIKKQKGYLDFGQAGGLILGCILLYIIGVEMVWGSLQERKEARAQAFAQAKQVQLKLSIKQLHSKEGMLEQLNKPFTHGWTYVGTLHELVTKSGASFRTEYDPRTIGHAMSLTNRILTGDSSPKVLDMTKELTFELEEKQHDLNTAWW